MENLKTLFNVLSTIDHSPLQFYLKLHLSCFIEFKLRGINIIFVIKYLSLIKVVWINFISYSERL